MKKGLMIFLTVLGVQLSVSACDICGCGVGSYYTGILPEFNKHIFGLRYRYNSLQTHLSPGGTASYLTTLEKFNTIDLWGGWMISQKVRLMAYVPVSFNEKVNQGNIERQNGIGDAGVQAFYQMFDNRSASGKHFISHSLWLGGGVKLPTGRYKNAQKDESGLSANTFQLGTGSIDFTINGMYDLRIQDFGINTTASYKINTANNESYQYGNKLSSTLQAYYKVRVMNKFTVAPNAGAAFETAAKDIDRNLKADISGGNITLLTAGAEVTTGKIAFGGSFQAPVSQHLANGSVRARDRLMLHISLML